MATPEESHQSQKGARSPLFIIFTTVVVDLIGFGMVIPLISLYGRHYGATSLELAVLGGIYSLMQFFFAPLWGSLSDRIGRRPVILVSLAGSTLSYLIFSFAPSTGWLLLARACGGIFAANISAAQAYIADVTAPKDRARGMGLIGAAFGIGFTLGPPLGGIASAKLGLAAPGLIASAICGVNLILAWFRLPESYPASFRKSAAEKRAQRAAEPPASLPARLLGLDRFEALRAAFQAGNLGIFFVTFFLVTFAFSTMEQTFSLLFQQKFDLTTGEAGYQTGLVLMASGALGAVIQGGLIRSLVKRYGEWFLLMIGLIFNAFGMIIFPFGQSTAMYFFLTLPLAVGSALINPSLSSLISKSVSQDKQGETLGLSQGLGSLARATGPFCGLLTFGIHPAFPYTISCFVSLALFLVFLQMGKKQDQAQGSLAT